jgi:hypothetical protein
MVTVLVNVGIRKRVSQAFNLLTNRGSLQVTVLLSRLSTSTEYGSLGFKYYYDMDSILRVG